MSQGNQPAFPFLEVRFGTSNHQHNGMTKREYFTAKAMQVLPPPVDYNGEKETRESYDNWANKCLRMADVILSKLKQ